MPHTWHDDITWALGQVSGISIHMPHTWHDNPFSRSDIRT